MKNTFKVIGTVSGFDSNGYIFVEEESTERPVMLTADENMMKYIEEVSWSDKEEKYIAREFLYNFHCGLVAVVVRSTNDRIPAKVVFSDWMNDTLKTFGAQGIIDEVKPAPMDRRDWYKAYDFMAEDYNIHYNHID